jgi:arylsulfatase A-like enzyme
MDPPAAPVTASRVLRGLPLALAGGLLLLLLSFVRRLGDVRTALFHDNILDSIYAGPILGTTLAHNLEHFCAALLALHLLFGAACWLAALLAEHAWPRVAASRTQWVLLWLCATTIALLAANARYFPASSLGEPYARAARAEWHGVSVTAALLAILGLAIAAALVCAGRRAWRSRPRPITLSALAAALLVTGAVTTGFVAAPLVGPRQSAAAPNIVLVGFDSLRTDVLSARSTPALEAFLAGGVQFTDVTTPIARTFPSWVAILTGNGPQRTGAVINLAPRAMVSTAGSLTDTLRTRGYHAVYAISETRFSNIDSSYGFDTTIMPPVGASDFIISWFGDAPLMNLLINSRPGERLFPFLYANRGAATTYEPGEFLDRLDRELPHQAPLFLVVHFMLAHWPYTWSDTLARPAENVADLAARYATAIPRVDAQFAGFLSMLQRRGVLDNAIVVVLSDHGESFEAPSDSLVAPDAPLLRRLDAVPTWGHGTSVLVPSQYRVLLGMRAYGAAQPLIPARGPSAAPATLMDLAPTLEELLGLRAGPHEGVSLAAVLRGADGAGQSLGDRIRLTETEYNPPGVVDAAGRPSTRRISEISRNYDLDPVSDRLQVSPKRLGSALARRQFAAIGTEELLAALPRPDGPGFQLLAVGLEGQRIEALDAPPDASTQPQRARLWEALRAHLPGEVTPEQ